MVAARNAPNAHTVGCVRVSGWGFLMGRGDKANLEAHVSVQRAKRSNVISNTTTCRGKTLMRRRERGSTIYAK